MEIGRCVTLVGAEEVQRAASRISEAASTMSQAAATIDEALSRQRVFLDEWLMRLDRLLAERGEDEG